MSKLDIIRAWKDEEYRNSLSSEQRALLPENPAGQIELTPSELEQAEGGTTSWTVTLVTLISVNICYSLYNQGTCKVASFGCPGDC